MTQPNGEGVASKELLFSITELQLRTLENATGAIERKASTFLGFEAVFVALILNTLAPDSGNYLDLILSYISVGLLLAGAALLVLCVFPRMHRFDPDPQGLVQNYWDRPSEEVRAKVTVNMADAWGKNFKTHEAKAQFLQWALRLVVAGVSLLVFNVFVVRVFSL